MTLFTRDDLIAALRDAGEPTGIRLVGGAALALRCFDRRSTRDIDAFHVRPVTDAAVIDASAGIELAAELLGHTDMRITIQHSVRRNEMVNPATADLLERAFARNGTAGGQGS